MGIFDRLSHSDSQESSHWPTAPGEISELDVRHTRMDGLVAEISYSYCTNGEYYSGVFQKKLPPFSSDRLAKEYIARVENITKIPVRYRPDKPEISTLVEAELDAVR
jgi:hypothetical protein